MTNSDDSKSRVAKGTEGTFLSRWSARKAQVAQGLHVTEGLDVPDARAEDAALTVGDAHDVGADSDEEAALTDTELLEKYELPDPAEVNDEDGLASFFDGKTPERLRQLALRRLWRINPFFGVVDEMVEYGEDYTDAATVIEGMQTAYQAGKGYLQKAMTPAEEAELENGASTDGASDDGVPESEAADGEVIEGDTPDGETPNETPDDLPKDNLPEENAHDAVPVADPQKHDAQAVGLADPSVHDEKKHEDNGKNDGGVSAEAMPSPVLPRPQRMTFRIKTES